MEPFPARGILRKTNIHLVNAKGDFRAEEEYILPSKIQQMCSDASTEESNFDYSRENGLCCDHLKHDADCAQVTSDCDSAQVAQE